MLKPWLNLGRIGVAFDVVQIGYGILVGNKERPIAVFYGPSENPDSAEHVALAVAAPDMLEALEEIAAEARSWHEFHHGSTVVACDSICALLPKLEAAICKARKR